MLGPRLSDHEALPVHRTPLEWLQSGRKGIVILDPVRARWEFAYLGCKLLVNDLSHGQSLRSALTIPAPPILISTSSIGQVAA